MAISDAMTAKLNEQITHEFGAAQIYLGMACMFENMSLKNLARWFRAQVNEEREHAMKILDYVLSHGAKVQLGAIPQPPTEYPSVIDAIEAALKHEQKVTGQINALADLADKEGDRPSQNFLSWFVDEQVEEEESVGYLLDVAKMASKNLLQLESAVVHLGRSS